MNWMVKHFVKLSFAAKERPASFAPGGDGSKSPVTARPDGFKAFKDWAARLDGTVIDTDQGLAAFVAKVDDMAAALSGAAGPRMKVALRGSTITVFYTAGNYPTQKDMTLLFFTVHPVRASVEDGILKIIQ